ncbi:hypothetical protein GOBAR_DD18557 [Gossypium barbadense]|nr:hypothetical protein GOBAR_DD18557 [Gossypium barbadense]
MPIICRHEIVGEVTEVGSEVEKVKVGDKVCVGCMVGACHGCDSWANDLENYSPKAKLIVTYNAPLLCARITVYSPLKGIVGLALVMLLLISTSPSKKAEALEHLGADSFLVSRDQDELQTVSTTHPIMPLLGLLKSNGKLIMVCAPYKPLELPVFSLIIGRKTMVASGIGGMKETKEIIDFAMKHNIKVDIEVISMGYVNKAMERLENADVRYRPSLQVENH